MVCLVNPIGEVICFISCGCMTQVIRKGYFSSVFLPVHKTGGKFLDLEVRLRQKYVMSKRKQTSKVPAKPLGFIVDRQPLAAGAPVRASSTTTSLNNEVVKKAGAASPRKITLAEMLVGFDPEIHGGEAMAFVPIGKEKL